MVAPFWIFLRNLHTFLLSGCTIPTNSLISWGFRFHLSSFWAKPRSPDSEGGKPSTALALPAVPEEAWQGPQAEASGLTTFSLWLSSTLWRGFSLQCLGHPQVYQGAFHTEDLTPFLTVFSFFTFSMPDFYFSSVLYCFIVGIELLYNVVLIS